MDAVAARGKLMVGVESFKEFVGCRVDIVDGLACCAVDRVDNTVVDVNKHDAVCKNAPNAANLFSVVFVGFYSLWEGGPRFRVDCAGLKVLAALHQGASIEWRLGYLVAALLRYPDDVSFPSSELHRNILVLRGLHMG